MKKFVLLLTAVCLLMAGCSSNEAVKQAQRTYLPAGEVRGSFPADLDKDTSIWTTYVDRDYSDYTEVYMEDIRKALDNMWEVNYMLHEDESYMANVREISSRLTDPDSFLYDYFDLIEEWGYVTSDKTHVVYFTRGSDLAVYLSIQQYNEEEMKSPYVMEPMPVDPPTGTSSSK